MIDTKSSYGLLSMVYLDILLCDDNLPGVSELYQQGEGQRVHVVDHYLVPRLLR